MEINKVNQMRKAKAIYSLLEQGSQPLSLGFGKYSKADTKVGNVYSGKRNGFRCVLISCCWHGDAGGELIKSGMVYVIA